jgi:hypothetical protein
MYNLAHNLVDNPLNRYAIRDRMPLKHETRRLFDLVPAGHLNWCRQGIQLATVTQSGRLHYLLVHLRSEQGHHRRQMVGPNRENREVSGVAMAPQE